MKNSGTKNIESTPSKYSSLLAEAVKAWCELHPGQARFVSLNGVANKTSIFREIASALGITSSYTRTAKRL